MANIHIKRKHNLPPEVVRARVEEIAKDLKRKLDTDYVWEGESLRFKRSGASGSIDMGDGFVEMKIKLNMVLSPMKGKIERTIKENIEVALADESGDTRLT